MENTTVSYPKVGDLLLVQVKTSSKTPYSEILQEALKAALEALGLASDGEFTLQTWEATKTARTRTDTFLVIPKLDALVTVSKKENPRDGFDAWMWACNICTHSAPDMTEASCRSHADRHAWLHINEYPLTPKLA